MFAGWTIDVRAMRAARWRITRLGAAGVIGVGLVANAAPAGAVVACSYDGATATLTLEKRDGLTIGRDDTGNIEVTDGAGVAVVCDSTDPITVRTVDNVVVVADPLDNDAEQVTIDMTNGRFVDPAGRHVHFTVDLGEREPDSLLIEGVDDSTAPDQITVTDTGIDLNGTGEEMDVVTSGVDQSLSPGDIPVGRVSSVKRVAGSFQLDVQVEPAADLDELTFVKVLLYVPEF